MKVFIGLGILAVGFFLFTNAFTNITGAYRGAEDRLAVGCLGMIALFFGGVLMVSSRTQQYLTEERSQERVLHSKGKNNVIWSEYSYSKPEPESPYPFMQPMTEFERGEARASHQRWQHDHDAIVQQGRAESQHRREREEQVDQWISGAAERYHTKSGTGAIFIDPDRDWGNRKSDN